MHGQRLLMTSSSTFDKLIDWINKRVLLPPKYFQKLGPPACTPGAAGSLRTFSRQDLRNLKKSRRRICYLQKFETFQVITILPSFGFLVLVVVHEILSPRLYPRLSTVCSWLPSRNKLQVSK